MDGAEERRGGGGGGSRSPSSSLAPEGSSEKIGRGRRGRGTGWTGHGWGKEIRMELEPLADRCCTGFFFQNLGGENRPSAIKKGCLLEKRVLADPPVNPFCIPLFKKIRGGWA